MNEITFELTNFCKHQCKFCSSNTTKDLYTSIFLQYITIRNIIGDQMFDIIHLSGGEPLAHPEFYLILEFCKLHANDVIVHTNALTHICYNIHVIDGIYIESNVTILPNVSKVHILKRIEQGKEKIRPEVHFSKNFTEECQCNHTVVLPNGNIVSSPCNKEKIENIIKIDGKFEQSKNWNDFHFEIGKECLESDIFNDCCGDFYVSGLEISETEISFRKVYPSAKWTINPDGTKASSDGVIAIFYYTAKKLKEDVIYQGRWVDSNHSDNSGECRIKIK